MHRGRKPGPRYGRYLVQAVVVFGLCTRDVLITALLADPAFHLLTPPRPESLQEQFVHRYEDQPQRAPRHHSGDYRWRDDVRSGNHCVSFLEKPQIGFQTSNRFSEKTSPLEKFLEKTSFRFY